MKRLHNVGFALFLACGTASTAIATDPPPTVSTRAEALTALASDNATHRADATAWFAGHGSGDDTRLLIERLSDESPTVREVAERGLWVLWAKSGDEEIDNLMIKGATELQIGQLRDAISTFSEVIGRKPDFAEAFNKRATALFMVGDFNKSLADCNEVIKRNPSHFGALAGFGQIYFHQEQYAKAIKYWKMAIEINPNMAGIQKNIKGAEEMMAISHMQTT